MSRSVKLKSVRKTIGDESVIKMFNQMMGEEDPHPDIIEPKFNKIRSKTTIFSKLLKSCSEDVLSKFVSYEDECKEINNFCEKLNSMNFDFKDKKEMCAIYKKYKTDNETIKTCIMTCKNLIQFKSHLNGDKADMSWVIRAPGITLEPFSFSKLNLKLLINDTNFTEHIKKYIHTTLKLTLKLTLELYRTITSPDIDIEKFSKVVVDSLGQLKKHIPRCDRAFSKIERSLSLLQNNFDGYYKDFIQSKNPSIIMESFILDVSRDGKADIQLARQFRQIVNFYKKQTQGKIKDPAVSKLFDVLSSNFKILETPKEEKKKTKNINIQKQ